MSNSRHARLRNRDGIAHISAVAIDEPTEEEQAGTVSCPKRRVDGAELRVGLTQLVIQHRLEQGQNLSVGVIDCCRQK